MPAQAKAQAASCAAVHGQSVATWLVRVVEIQADIDAGRPMLVDAAAATISPTLADCRNVMEIAQTLAGPDGIPDDNKGASLPTINACLAAARQG
jgi:hypothetical protein